MVSENAVKDIFWTPDENADLLNADGHIDLLQTIRLQAGVITAAYFGLQQKRPLSPSNTLGLCVKVQSIVSSEHGVLFYNAPEQINAIFHGAKLGGAQEMSLEDLSEHLFGRQADEYWNPQRLVRQDIRLHWAERWPALPSGFSYWDKPVWFDGEMQRDREDVAARNSSYWP